VIYQDPRYRDPEYRVKWAEANPERGAAYLTQKKRRYHENPVVMRERARKNYADHREERKASSREYYRSHREEQRLTTMLRRFGLSREGYLAFVGRQDGRCAICRIEGRLSVDHNHATGEVRGLLCATCNFMIGHGKDDPGLLRAAAAYLERM